VSHFTSRLLLPLAVLALGALPVALASAATPRAGNYHGFADDATPTGPLPCGHDESEAYFHATKRAITPLTGATCGLPPGSLTDIVFPNLGNLNGCGAGNATLTANDANKVKVTDGKFSYTGKSRIYHPSTGSTNGPIKVTGRWVSATKVKGKTIVGKPGCSATTKWTMVKAPA
jgi:hypothetical protein